MHGSRIVVDGLWRCLCPSIDTIVLGAALRSRLTTARASSTRGLKTRAPACRIRTLHQAALAVNTSDEELSENLVRKRKVEGIPLIRKYEFGNVRSPSEDECDHSITANYLVTQCTGNYPELLRAPTSVIVEAVEELQYKNGQALKLRTFFDYLVEVRKVDLTTELCNAVLASHSDRTGSADEVRNLLKRMKDGNIHRTPVTFRNALWALAIHPDYLTRNEVLETMRSLWVTLDDSMKHAVALGLLRDGQYEQAAGKLEDMIQGKLDIPLWVWDTFIYKYGQLGFLDEAVALMGKRLELTGDIAKIPLNPWYFLLDECSRGMHYEGTKFTWDHLVRTGTLNPADGVVLNVLNTAARARDGALATEAIRYLSARGVRLGMHHYEAVIDCYALNEDIENALQVLCIMARARVRPNQASTRTLFGCLKGSASLSDKAMALLFKLRRDYEIPIAALNVVLEAYAEQDNTSAAVDLYRGVRDLCNSGPETHTFQVLLSRPVTVEIADFLASEMSAFSIKPTTEIFDILINSYCGAGDLDTAFNYVRQFAQHARLAKTPGVWLSKGTLDTFIRRCIQAEDTRLWRLVDEAMHRGMHPEENLRRILAEFRDETQKNSQARRKAILAEIMGQQESSQTAGTRDCSDSSPFQGVARDI